MRAQVRLARGLTFGVTNRNERFCLSWVWMIHESSINCWASASQNSERWTWRRTFPKPAERLLRSLNSFLASSFDLHWFSALSVCDSNVQTFSRQPKLVRRCILPVAATNRRQQRLVEKKLIRSAVKKWDKLGEIQSVKCRPISQDAW